MFYALFTMQKIFFFRIARPFLIDYMIIIWFIFGFVKFVIDILVITRYNLLESIFI